MTEWTEYAIEQKFSTTGGWLAILSDTDADEIWRSFEACKYAASLSNDGLDRQYRVVERKCRVIEVKDQTCSIPEGYYAVSWADEGAIAVATSSGDRGVEIDNALYASILSDLKILLGHDPIDIGTAILRATADVATASGMSSGIVMGKLADHAKDIIRHGATEGQAVLLLRDHAAAWLACFPEK
jgi:hypothetical protein